MSRVLWERLFCPNIDLTNNNYKEKIMKRSSSSSRTPRSKAAKQGKVHKVMKEFKEGELKSGLQGKSGKVKSRKQAIAIAMHESGQSRDQSSART
jgi:hypothetical protein